MERELFIKQAAAVLGRHHSVIAKRAIEVDQDDARAVRAALADKRLPGRRVGQVWLFDPRHVRMFAKVQETFIGGAPPKVGRRSRSPR
ncbi:MAG: hypothetical protein ACREQ5_30865 [Candidatus Dormibacteria bacterium]